MRYEAPDFYVKTPHAEIARLADESESINAKIDALVTEWEAIEAEIAQNAG